jgi:two-component system alkaline phosphatase synthesis response regulator PhoP
MNSFLLVEDDELVGSMVRINLESEGNVVQWHTDGREGLSAATSQPFDLILLDISLPGLNGLEVLKIMRQREIGTPVLMLTAQSDVASKVKALQLGADDYLAKPFDVSEMMARVHALIRRSQATRQIPSDRTITIGSHTLNLETREASSEEGPVTLSEKEAEIVRLLVEAGGTPVSRSEILDQVWGRDRFPSDRTVDNYMLRLRKLFEPDPDHPRHFLTVRGAGYRFDGRPDAH